MQYKYLCFLLLLVACRVKPHPPYRVFNLYGNKVFISLPMELAQDTSLPHIVLDYDSSLFYDYFLSPDTSFMIIASAYRIDSPPVHFSFRELLHEARGEGASILLDTALEQSPGKTIALMRCTIDRKYPRRHSYGFAQVFSNGIVSELEFGYRGVDTVAFWNMFREVSRSVNIVARP